MSILNSVCPSPSVLPPVIPTSEHCRSSQQPGKAARKASILLKASCSLTCTSDGWLGSVSSPLSGLFFPLQSHLSDPGKRTVLVWVLSKQTLRSELGAGGLFEKQSPEDSEDREKQVTPEGSWCLLPWVPCESLHGSHPRRVCLVVGKLGCSCTNSHPSWLRVAPGTWSLFSTFRGCTLAKHLLSARERLAEGHRKPSVCSGTLFSDFRVGHAGWLAVPFPQALRTSGPHSLKRIRMCLFVSHHAFPLHLPHSSPGVVLSMTCGCNHTLLSMESLKGSSRTPKCFKLTHPASAQLSLYLLSPLYAIQCYITAGSHRHLL